jgi:hypothetical protein
MKTLIIILLTLVLLVVATPVKAQTPDNVLPPGTFVPLVGGCQRILGLPEGSTFEQLYARLDTTKHVVWYQSDTSNGDAVVRQNNLCFNVGNVCTPTNTCDVQIILRDNFMNRCWKSVIFTYDGNKRDVPLQLTRDLVCPRDLVLP